MFILDDSKKIFFFLRFFKELIRIRNFKELIRIRNLYCRIVFRRTKTTKNINFCIGTERDDTFTFGPSVRLL